MSARKTIMGLGPVQDDVHIGADGQLWRWENGQVLIATSGSAAIKYAKTHNWPDSLVSILKINRSHINGQQKYRY